MQSSYWLHILVLLYLTHDVLAGGSPVLIKMDGKKDKKGNHLILIAGGKCGSPTLIKGGGKKGKGGELILVGGQNDNCHEKKEVKVVKQFVPVPYYVPKPIYKYILRHHYVPVRQVVVKPVPVPYPVKYNKKEYKEYKKNNHDSGSEGAPYYGAASSDTFSQGGLSQGGLSQGDTSGYDGQSDLNYSQGDGSVTSSSNAMDYGTVNSGAKYSLSGSGAQPVYDSYGSKSMGGSSSLDSGASHSSPYGSPYGYENSNHGLHSAASTLSPSTVSQTGNSGGNMKTSASENYYYGEMAAFTQQQQQQQPRGYYDDAHYGSYASGRPNKVDTTGSYQQHQQQQQQQSQQLYAPVYTNDQGQLYSTGQVFPSTVVNSMGRGSGAGGNSLPSSAASVISAFPAPYASSPYTPSSLTSSVFSAVGPGMAALSSYADSGLMSMTGGETTTTTSFVKPIILAKKKKDKKESFSLELQKKAKKLFSETFNKRTAKTSSL